MACDISLGRIEPCKTSNGGLKAVYFVNEGDATGVTYDATNTDAIATVTGTPSAYKYDLKGINSFESTSTVSQETAGKVFDQSITITLKGIDQSSSSLFAEIVSFDTKLNCVFILIFAALPWKA